MEYFVMTMMFILMMTDNINDNNDNDYDNNKNKNNNNNNSIIIIIVYKKELSKNDYLKTLLITIIKSLKIWTDKKVTT